jgi:hypothetical protein
MRSALYLPRIKAVVLFSFLFVAGLVCTAHAAQKDLPVVPVKGKVTMLDLGATSVHTMQNDGPDHAGA